MIQDLFELSTWTLAQRHKELQEYQKSIDRERYDDKLFESMHLETISKYKSSPHFQKWESPDKSSMLLLVGSNHEIVMESRHHCWISPLALDLIDTFTANSRTHAFYAFKLSGRTGIHPAVSEILFQLLTWKRRELGSEAHFATLRAGLKDYRSINVKDDDAKLDALCHLARSTMRLFRPDETVYIVLDRIDRCEENDRIDFLNALIDIMEEAVGSVKIFAIANGTGWDVEERDLKKTKRTHVKQVFEHQKLLFDGQNWA